VSGPRLVHALVAHTDGRISEHQVRDDLATLQAHVGGDVEYLALTSGVGLFCNGNGLFDGLPHNDLATRTAVALRPELAATLAVYGLRGDVVFLGGPTPAGNNRDCPRAIHDMLRAAAATRQGGPS
jgi:hypothetical protein